MRRGPGNNPIGVVRDVVVSDDAFTVTLDVQESLDPPGYPATLWSLSPSRPAAELHRLIGASPDRLVLTYRTRPVAALDCHEQPRIGDEGEIIQWWLPGVLEMITIPEPPLARRPSSAVRCDFCHMCWKSLPDGSWAWEREGLDICGRCRDQFVERDLLRLREPE